MKSIVEKFFAGKQKIEKAVQSRSFRELSHDADFIKLYSETVGYMFVIDTLMLFGQEELLCSVYDEHELKKIIDEELEFENFRLTFNSEYVVLDDVVDDKIKDKWMNSLAAHEELMDSLRES